MLTRKQRELLIFIADYIEGNNGLGPTLDEMAKALGLKAKSGAHRLVEGLEERGFIRRIPNRARAIEVLCRPDAEERQLAAMRAFEGIYPIPKEASVKELVESLEIALSTLEAAYKTKPSEWDGTTGAYSAIIIVRAALAPFAENRRAA